MRQDPAETFRQEAAELLEQLEQGLMDLGEAPDDSDLVNSVFRALHTIKGRARCSASRPWPISCTSSRRHSTAFARDRARQHRSSSRSPLQRKITFRG